ncbi:MAG: DNA mismatch endonuclease Vsr [Thiocapsa sp.]|uniref:very short patch repair endonuclease n=1 Tax=Thiocapsa sp. TaxID=2024551 RepID=UPI001BCC320B|nr:DNA mismatch endonuclease Vsr [Thiocapsa sp.]QVL50900.1 MAG: DNA mismatch endonuclease Vsr [Thiocapsa sp.]
MTDRLTPAQRSRLMARVVGKDTKPEWILRSALHRLGFRYRLGGGGLPGRPDLILPKYRAVVFVHGCFWHHHADCKRATLPRTNASFWKEKLERNVARDAEAIAALEAAGWGVVVVWECELYRDPVAAVSRVVAALTGELSCPRMAAAISGHSIPVGYCRSPKRSDVTGSAPSHSTRILIKKGNARRFAFHRKIDWHPR